jgi:hypothetical protein
MRRFSYKMPLGIDLGAFTFIYRKPLFVWFGGIKWDGNEKIGNIALEQENRKR